MSTMRAYTREFRESAVGLVLSEGLSIRKAADDLGMPYRTLHGWVRAARRSRRKPVQKVQPRTKADAEARVRASSVSPRKSRRTTSVLRRLDQRPRSEGWSWRSPSSAPLALRARFAAEGVLCRGFFMVLCIVPSSPKRVSQEIVQRTTDTSHQRPKAA